MRFTYDPDKSVSNLAKHGISFDAAQAIWDDPRLLEAPARTMDEPRWLAIGKIGGRHWTAVWTPRNDTIRLISVRRSRKEEVAIYESP